MNLGKKKAKIYIIRKRNPANIPVPNWPKKQSREDENARSGSPQEAAVDRGKERSK